ncbi:hypothetical protein [Mesorhizobium sp.]|uniref:hypothetical protein n=1 Tax=Mesorhizobium sp. TaxID=1871066 RepID=UPI000FE9F703|nr:hypothetical protein [Mesorhizobium sp.]RWE85112.1 MAG: hypothetical protein EOS49_18450 [Mesorhizobium sp.]
MLTAGAIAVAKRTTPYRHPAEVLHEDDDCIRIAYEWLDAQTKTKAPVRKTRATKHLVEQWGARYVSQSDVEVAAHMHPDIVGSYPHYNLSARLICPSLDRLKGISQANTQMSYRDTHLSELKHNYAAQE